VENGLKLWRWQREIAGETSGSGQIGSDSYNVGAAR
jgi:hypothetical protein